MRRIFGVITLAILMVALLAGCQEQAGSGAPSTNGPLSLEISSPSEGRETSWGFVTVAGTVSPPEAEVNVNETSANVTEDGSFESDYLLLDEGENKLTATATLGGKSISKTVTVNYSPKLHVSISLNLEMGHDWFAESPAEIGGRISDPRAEVIVNGRKAEVTNGGYFSVVLDLTEGENQIEAIATLEGQTDTDTTEALYVPPVPLKLNIDSPADGVETGINLIKVAGTVSDPEASVSVNNIKAPVSAGGYYYAYVRIKDGENRIDAVATRGNESVTDTVLVIYNSALTRSSGITLAISSPQSETEYHMNLVPVTGSVSMPDATVLIDGREPTVSADGGFEAYAVIEEGENNIEVIAIKGNSKTVENVSVTFSPALVVDLDYPSPVRGIDYTREPITITGKVNKPEATVTVNDQAVDVKQDGTFTAQEKLTEGSSSITAVATSGNERDEVYILFMVENGFPNPVPGYSHFFTASLKYEHEIVLKAGETWRLPLLLETRKDGPGRFSGRLFHVDREYGLLPRPMPEGLDAYLEPPEFIAYPNTSYSPVLVFRTTSEIVPGVYYLHFYNNLEKGFYESGWIKVTVEGA